MRHDDRDEERRRCGICGKSLRPFDSISVTDVGERCNRCFNEELADRIGIAFDNTPIVVAAADGAEQATAFLTTLERRLDLELPVPRPKGAEHGRTD